MKSFIEKHQELLVGILNGFDRLVIRGTLRNLAHAGGMFDFLCRVGVLLKNFGSYVEQTTLMLKNASMQEANRLHRPIVYLPASGEDKNKIARDIMIEDKIDEGLICVLKSVEPCLSYEVHRNKKEKILQLNRIWRKCLHLYHYWIDEAFGFSSASIQTWFPFNIQVCLNGREWLAWKLDEAGIAYTKSDNCFLRIEDLPRAQEFMQEQLTLKWLQAMDKIALRLNPAFNKIFDKYKISYYWTIFQSEWATDIMFKSHRLLASIYPQLVRGAMSTFSSPDVMRFLGGKIFHGRFKGEVVSDYKKRPEGMRAKHHVNRNSVKMYDKKGCILRVETTINNPRDFRVYYSKEKQLERKNKPKWRKMRKGVSDIYSRVQASQTSNERYIEALAGLDTDTPIKDLVQPICLPVKWKGKRVRQMQPWKKEDVELLLAIRRGEFCINGFRNKDLVQIMYPQVDDFSSEKERKKVAAKCTRKIRLLRAHGLIRKMPNSYRYVTSKKGNEIIPAVLGYRECSLRNLYKEAA
ncbi:MAG: hypothetical protein GY950_12745 [bacterium]|nr:hypothetical protein [bacterium]